MTASGSACVRPADPEANMGTIHLQDAGLLAPRPLFRHLDLALHGGDRLGLVAGNGAGKSSLLRCLAGQAELGEGEVIRSRGLRVGLVPQDVPPHLLGQTLIDAVQDAVPGEEWRAGLVLDELQAPDAMRSRPLRALSGGWQRLALLARVWATEPDALLLDEPTNHLDVERIRLLEAWLTGPARQALVVVASHDRAFLDAATTHTLFLRPERSRAYAHPYTAARALLQADDAALHTKLAVDAKEVDRLRRNAGKLRNVGVNSGSDLLQKKSMQLTKRADALEQTLQPAHRERPGTIRLASRDSHAKVLASLRDLTVRSPDGARLFHIAKLDVLAGDRLVLLGRNGAGKSQLVQALRRAALGEAVPGIRISATAVLGYADQTMSQLPEAQTPHRFIAGLSALGDQRAVSLLAGAGFPPEAQRRPIGSLSPGQKSRLGLLALRLAAPNFFLLDEPTNHVDIPGQEQLEGEILRQDATCVLVSHDRRFAEAVGSRFIRIEGGGLVELDGVPRD